MSVTIKNLEAALAGESQAHIKYRYFAKIARTEGYEEVAKHFEHTADQELLHAWGHLELLIGKPSTKECLEKGWYVFGIDKMTYASNISFLEEFNSYTNFRFEKKDICDIDRLVDCDYFINTAAETHVDNSIRKSDDFLHSNINGVYNILELLKNYKKGRIIPWGV